MVGPKFLEVIVSLRSWGSGRCFVRAAWGSAHGRTEVGFCGAGVWRDVGSPRGRIVAPRARTTKRTACAGRRE
jgi:hypothetical protein